MSISNQEITRKILSKIDNDSAISQKRLAEEIDISVGAINWHIKRCVSKGLIKLKQAPVRRYLYYLTPEGFAEKTRLTANYLQAGFDIFNTGRKQYENIFHKCLNNNWNVIVLFGDTMMTELALLVASRFPNTRIIGVVDKETSRNEYFGIRIVTSPDQLIKSDRQEQVQAVVACHYKALIDGFTDRELVLDAFGLDRTRFLVPEFLK